jgi:hypothetical protein
MVLQTSEERNSPGTSRPALLTPTNAAGKAIKAISPTSVVGRIKKPVRSKIMRIFDRAGLLVNGLPGMAGLPFA